MTKDEHLLRTMSALHSDILELFATYCELKGTPEKGSITEICRQQFIRHHDALNTSIDALLEIEARANESQTS